jgi:dihydrofolate synthase/folylpolyglutamate synthase
LGETREAIGREKAGIFRTGVPAVIGDPDPPESLLQSADSINAKVYRYGTDFKFEKHAQNWDWIADNEIMAKLPLPALKGEHQFLNASTVLQTISIIQSLLPVSKSAINKGLQSVNLWGRYQLIEGDIPVLLDVGHNPQAVRALVKYLQHSFFHRKIHAVFSMMKDKDIKGVVEIMKPLVHSWFITPALNSRSADEQMMRTAFELNAVDNVTFGFSSFEATFIAAQANAVQEDLILVFGSFFLVSEFLAGLKQGIYYGN